MVKRKSITKRERKREKDKVGRNDPCPCKSGKKYKKCCLRNDLAQRMAESSEQKSFKEYFVNSLKKEQAEREEGGLFDWQQFRLSPFEIKISLFKSEFENVDPFDLLDIIYQQAAREGKIDEFNECLDFLQLNSPQSYEENEMYYSSWLLRLAIINNHYTPISAFLESYRRHPDDIFDIFLRDIDLLMFSGRTTELLELMVEVAPIIVSSHKIMPHCIDEFLGLLSFLLILQFIEHNDLNEQNMMKLLSRLEDLEIGFEEEVVRQTILRLSGQLKTEWKPDRFDDTIQRKKREKNFFDLSVDFLLYLYTEHNIPFSQSELARNGIVNCLLRQTRLKKRKDEASILYPRERELDKHLSIYLDMFAPRPSRLVAAVGFLPYYVLFLAENGLVHWHHVKRVVSDVEPLKINILKYFDNHALGNYYIPMINNMWDIANRLINEKILYYE